MQKNVQMLVACETLTSGRTSREIKDLDIAAVIKTLYYYAGSVGNTNSINMDAYDPIGIVAIFGHYDSPLLSIVNKLAASLATGNCCIVVPNKNTPLSAFLFAEICMQSGLPNGVLNMLAHGNDEIYANISSNSFINCITYDGNINVNYFSKKFDTYIIMIFSNNNHNYNIFLRLVKN